jgi:hypothetical protein
MAEHKLVDGVKVILSDAEIAQRQAEETAWNNGAFDRSLASLRAKRNSLLAQTDYQALVDNTLSEPMKAYRQQLRDLTEGLSTVEQVNSIVFPTKP